jgi:threonine dehydratase
MQGLAWLFFLIFAAVLVGMYIGIRRELAGPGLIAGVGVAASMILMVLVSLAQENSLIQAVVVGILVGGLFSGATLGVAWYFHNNEVRARYAANADVYDESAVAVEENA